MARIIDWFCRTRTEFFRCQQARLRAGLGARRRSGAFSATAIRAPAENSIVARFLTIAIGRSNGQAKSQKLPHRRRARRHPVFEAKVVDDGQFAGREHDLQALIADISHLSAPEVRQLSRCLTPPLALRFRHRQRSPQLSKMRLQNQYLVHLRFIFHGIIFETKESVDGQGKQASTKSPGAETIQAPEP